MVITCVIVETGCSELDVGEEVVSGVEDEEVGVEEVDGAAEEEVLGDADVVVGAAVVLVFAVVVAAVVAVSDVVGSSPIPKLRISARFSSSPSFWAMTLGSSILALVTERVDSAITSTSSNRFERILAADAGSKIR